nr:NUDIX domain-containing protein [Neobacillus mesonae]
MLRTVLKGKESIYKKELQWILFCLKRPILLGSFTPCFRIGGAMELRESLEQTAKRELFEETGLKVKNFRFVDIFSGKDLYFKYPNNDEVYNIICIFLAEGVKW